MLSFEHEKGDGDLKKPDSMRISQVLNVSLPLQCFRGRDVSRDRRCGLAFLTPGLYSGLDQRGQREQAKVATGDAQQQVWPLTQFFSVSSL